MISQSMVAFTCMSIYPPLWQGWDSFYRPASIRTDHTTGKKTPPVCDDTHVSLPRSEWGLTSERGRRPAWPSGSCPTSGTHVTSQ